MKNLDATEFPEYAANYSKTAVESRSKLSTDLLPILHDIEGELCEDPHRYPERIIPASVDGTSFVYMHPDPAIQITFEINPERKIIYFFHFSAPGFQARSTIFVSYSHADREWLVTIKKFLTVLEQKGLITFWDDTQIEKGEKWKSQIDEKLESSKGAVLLVSQDFLVSDFITKFELPKILADAGAKGKKVFWIHLSASTVFQSHQKIAEFQSLLDDPKTPLEELDEPRRKKALVKISQDLAKAIS